MAPERYLLQAAERPTHRFGFLGVPHDAATTNARPGARYAPDALRHALQDLLAKRLGDDRRIADLEDGLVDLAGTEIVDFGDVSLNYADGGVAREQTRAAVAEILQAGYIPIVVGGDHGVTFPAVQAVHDATEGTVGVVQFDAHPDLTDGNEKQGRYSGSSVMRRIAELERVRPSNIVQIGLRGYTSAEQYEVGEALGIKRISATRFNRVGGLDAAREALAWSTRSASCVYLTVDVDVLDPGAAPGTGWPEPGGITAQGLSDAVKTLAPHASGIDLVELNPIYDSDHSATLLVAVRLVLDFITSRVRAHGPSPTTGDDLQIVDPSASKTERIAHP